MNCNTIVQKNSDQVNFEEKKKKKNTVNEIITAVKDLFKKFILHKNNIKKLIIQNKNRSVKKDFSLVPQLNK